MKIIKEKSYKEFLSKLKEKVRTAQLKAALTVNAEMLFLYWELGKDILHRQNKEGWGAGVIPQLSKDLQSSFPEMKGLASRNLGYMKKFAEEYPDFSILQQAAAKIGAGKKGIPILQQVVAKLPWGHNCLLIDKIKNKEERLWYMQQVIENGWSRAVMEHHIESDLFHRQSKKLKTTNFKSLLPKAQSELAEQALKDPYVFDFLNLSKEHKEKDLEDKLIEHITKFLIELGAGFAFVGRQYHLEVGNEDFYIDLLFYHIHLKCYVVIELKIDKFKPEYAGKLNFYQSAVDDILKRKDDNPTIGILLCPTKNNVVVEYALRDMSKPMGISEYRLSKKMPPKLQKELPGISELKHELEEEMKKKR